MEQIPALDIPKGRTNFLFIGRWYKEKGVDILLDAMNLLVKEEQRHAYLYLLGKGPLASFIQRKVRDYGLEDFVYIGGYVGPREVVAYMSVCDYLIIPSRVESIPVVFHDAMQVGIQVIAADVGDLGNVVREYRVGIVVPSENPIALKDAMRAAMQRNPRENWRCLQKAANELGLEKATERYLAAVACFSKCT